MRSENRQSHMKRRTTLLTFLTAIVAIAVLATACSSSGESGSEGPDASQNTAEGGGNSGGGESGGGESGGGESGNQAAQGVVVRSDGPGQNPADTEVIITLDDADGSTDGSITRENVVDGDPLSPDVIDQLLARLPDLEAEATDQVGFNRPPDTRPPPRSGQTIEGSFPPEVGAPTAETATGPLEVLRFQPEGPVDLAPFLAITFNQPMVPLTTLNQVEAADVPITVSPELPGRWLWLGTKTVRFEYEPGAIDRLPAATNYTVTIPAGTTSLTGGELAEAVSFDFSTPTPTVRSVTPMNSSLSTEPTFFIRFDQRIDPESVLGTIDLRADGEDVAIRLATGEEVNEDTQIANLAENALPERWMAIRPVDELPTDAAIDLIVGPNVPSAEGPETSPTTEQFSGRTYGPLEVERHRCGWGDRCQPGMPFMIEMSNPLDTETFSADMVTVTPPIPGVRIGLEWNTIVIQGRTAGQTEYDVTVSTAVSDVFGQNLAVSETRSFAVGDADPALFQPGRTLATLDPILDDNRLLVTTINNDELVVTAYEVQPRADWDRFRDRQWELLQGDFNPNWPVAFERTVSTNAERNEFTDVPLELADAVSATGHSVIVVEPANRRQDDWQNQPFAIWVQNAKIAVDATNDNDETLAWVTDLVTGLPVSGATVEIFGGESGTTNAVR